MTSSEVSTNSPAASSAQPWVIDTNIVLDLWLFEDPATEPLRAALQSGRISHLATRSMRDELERVLTYPHIVKRMAKSNIQAQDILNRFDQHHVSAEPADKAPCTCKDPDDQKFIDLAVAHGVPLLSKDAAILCMKKRLSQSGVVLNPSDIPAQ
ncbi:putative toxin-antitoxin system toxin component, PIN family [Limnohabitans sp. Hippo4]|uniref:putative toxin-antitoxin system toxin component, PIN family n=1 Tax=Limnohabitans sp. Hippo4 TaxID=1826167 RepID=UPI001E5C39D4|nr:putative toxin-antitoxin system toxin component, PIN family [Limnohabitans sp. Hippo4]